MEEKELINEITYYLGYLRDVYTKYIIHKRILDWLKNSKEELKQFSCFLGMSKESLARVVIINFSELFSENSSSKKNFIKFFNKINFLPSDAAYWITYDIKSIANQILDEIKKYKKTIKTPTIWRNKAYAHFDDIFDKEKILKFQKKNQIQIEEIIKLIIFTFEKLKDMLVFLGIFERPILYNNTNDIDNFMLQALIGSKLEKENKEKWKKYLKNINIPKDTTIKRGDVEIKLS